MVIVCYGNAIYKDGFYLTLNVTSAFASEITKIATLVIRRSGRSGNVHSAQRSVFENQRILTIRFTHILTIYEYVLQRVHCKLSFQFYALSFDLYTLRVGKGIFMKRLFVINFKNDLNIG